MALRFARGNGGSNSIEPALSTPSGTVTRTASHKISSGSSLPPAPVRDANTLTALPPLVSPSTHAISFTIFPCRMSRPSAMRSAIVDQPPPIMQCSPPKAPKISSSFQWCKLRAPSFSEHPYSRWARCHSNSLSTMSLTSSVTTPSATIVTPSGATALSLVTAAAPVAAASAASLAPPLGVSTSMAPPASASASPSAFARVCDSLPMSLATFTRVAPLRRIQAVRSAGSREVSSAPRLVAASATARKSSHTALNASNTTSSTAASICLPSRASKMGSAPFGSVCIDNPACLQNAVEGSGLFS
mmetsp:Transcript_8589/g.35003  ORF Transcript_8589/g.35003 Transcript_8589/m.35003 type:complete len:302 (+) Transcript_8589:1581-2486(+)